MSEKPAIKEMEKRIKEFEDEISASKKTINALRESEVRYREIFKNSKNGIIVYDSINDGQDFYIVDCNPSCERMEVLERDSLIGKNVLQVFPGIKEFGLFDVLKKVWKSGEPQKLPAAIYKDERISGWRDNFVYRLPTGEIVVIYSDETDRMMAEQALQESYERMEAILFSLPTGIMIIDVETHEILQANPQAMLMIGLPIEKIIGLKYHQFIDLPEVRGPNDDDLLCSGSEGKLLAADGEIVPVHQTVIPVTFDNRDCVIVNFAVIG